MPILEAYADTFSKSHTTKVGAYIVNSDLNVISHGYNGAPRGCSADEVGDARSKGQDKLKWVVHAEVNSITNMVRLGSSALDTTILTTHYPCLDCAKIITQVGISAVITYKPTGKFAIKWGESIIESRKLFKEVGIVVVEI